jgi:hypothetical protein
MTPPQYRSLFAPSLSHPPCLLLKKTWTAITLEQMKKQFVMNRSLKSAATGSTAPQSRPGLVAFPNLDHDFFKSSFLRWTRCQKCKGKIYKLSTGFTSVSGFKKPRPAFSCLRTVAEPKNSKTKFTSAAHGSREEFCNLLLAI